jgi:hypothetical protein
VFDFPALLKTRAVDRMLLALALLFGAASIAANSACKQSALQPSDQFDPDLQSIRTVDAAVAYVKGSRSGTDPQSLADATDAFVRKRFVHGYSQFAPCENWIAFLAGYLWIDLREPVLPNDILQHRRGACSQQGIVFEAIARDLGLDAGSVGMTGHFLPAVQIGGRWMVYDPDREITPNSYPLQSLLAGDPRIEQRYGRFGRELDMVGQAAAGQIHLFDVNTNPAPQASFFHRATYVFSHFGWALFLGLYLMLTTVRAFAADRVHRRRHRHLAALAAVRHEREPIGTVDVQVDDEIKVA